MLIPLVLLIHFDVSIPGVIFAQLLILFFWDVGSKGLPLDREDLFLGKYIHTLITVMLISSALVLSLLLREMYTL